jgi:hypothetical protein
MTRRNITDRALQALKPAPQGKHHDVWDRDGFGVRVSDKGTKTFVLMARYPGSSNPTRRAIGHYPTVGLAAARATASRWREWIAVGKDPAVEMSANDLPNNKSLRLHSRPFAKISSVTSCRLSARVVRSSAN